MNNTENNPRVPESLLSEIWKGQWVHKGPLPSSEGKMVRVRSPGTENRDSGPDFLRAVIILDDEIVEGDVELHVRSSDWHAHGHHRDPHFNRVVLQVVLWDDAKKPARLENGGTVPTVSLYNYLNGSLDELSVQARAHPAPPLPCKGAGTKLPSSLLAILKEYGKDRFYVKSASFEINMILEEPEQVLYQGIMGALGYTKNKKPFQELAQHLPLRVLESFARESQNPKTTLQALLLGAAGLLPSQCGHKSGLGNHTGIAEVERVWQSLNIESPMTYTDWHFFRMHPKNFPSQRLLAAGYLFTSYLERGLLSGVLNLLQEATANKPALIEKGFVVRGLLGLSRARDIAVNVILPFGLAWAEMKSDYKLKQHVLELYESYPRLSENQITRYLGGLFWDTQKSDINSAQLQQGLIHLYKTFCQDRCERCPISMASARHPFR